MRTAFGGDPVGVVLEFEFLSGKIVGKQSMGSWRCGQRRFNASELSLVYPSTSFTGVSGVSPPRRRANVSLPLSSHLPATARLA
jgi:hypothetical protein